MKKHVNIFWFRRDLRLEDNTGLFHSLSANNTTLPIFIFDTEIIEKLPINDARISFIYKTLQKINLFLRENYRSGISVYKGKPLAVFQQLISSYNISAVYINRDYEPYALKRDDEVKGLLSQKSIPLLDFKDQVIFEKKEVSKKDDSPYTVFTPYMKKWKAQLSGITLNYSPSSTLLHKLKRGVEFPFPELSDIGFQNSDQNIKSFSLTSSLIKEYQAYRDFPARETTTRLGPHLRFGTVSIRLVVKKVLETNGNSLLNELVWREFFTQILWHYPYTVYRSFKPKYDRITWRNNPDEFERWCKGETGYPLVDAGMRQLNQTGYMHNRVRMVTASFLCKHLLIDWRWGETYFAQKLHDYELASNVGNWQWAAGSGVDAAPYFRIFNPLTQAKKFDKDLKYITTWVKNYQSASYPSEIVNHQVARVRALDTYKRALST